MADIGKIDEERQKYVDDPRIACKYGAKCYQKNSIHQSKYKHPPIKKRLAENVTNNTKRIKIDIDNVEAIKDNVEEKLDIEMKQDDHISLEQEKKTGQVMDISETSTIRTPKDFDHKEFIKKKFLVEMPSDFYQFYDFCKKLNSNKPLDALKNIGLTLVGPYDVLAGKFRDVIDQPDENYLIHWRYFRDPPEFQTVLKGDEKSEYHIGYFRDSPAELPVFLASNSSKNDGVLKVMGDNIFASVSLYLDDLKKTGDPFKKMYVGKYQNMIKEKAKELKLDLSEKTEGIRNRNSKIVARSFNKAGMVIPYNRKTQVGYRDLGVSNKQLIRMLDNIQKALPEQKAKFLSDLQPVMTNASIATDECDFGAGIELGLDILAHGLDNLNATISRFLSSNYRLIGRETFAKIAEAHMKKRKKGSNLSIV